jgi:malate dehydrogenase (oxaloacetate-decarboxylating)
MSLPLLVREVMTPSVISVEASSSVRDAAQVMIERGVGSVIVMEAGRPVGILTERDVLRRVVVKGLDPVKTKVGEVTSSPLVTVRADAVAGLTSLLITSEQL